MTTTANNEKTDAAKTDAQPTCCCCGSRGKLTASVIVFILWLIFLTVLVVLRKHGI